MVFAGLLIAFPALVFGGSLAWWGLAVAISGWAVARYLLPKTEGGGPVLGKTLRDAFRPKECAVSIFAFAILYMIAASYGSLASFNLRLIVPLFRFLTPPARVIDFFVLLPFFLAYFLIEGAYLHVMRPKPKPGAVSGVGNALSAVAIKVVPFLVVILVDYLPAALLNVRLFPSMVSFVLMFLWLVTPIFAAITAISWWFYRLTGRIGAGALLNAMLVAWIAAAVFPLGVFL